MTFADDDLKRLKESRTAPYWSEEKWMRALLARLEAAEKIANYLDGFDGVNNPIVNELLKAWCKACGR